ncbi:MAG: hypothetical protein EZS28_035300 [Streblomastix strix]|uniref:Ubiquitin-like domain-containing protein n=1 Tax=Streblomastix strix TaxID=222440 RepID=A0A5J4UFZ2_9EUKA|nr:MAG: hypothetical protein EZS28_035300 [Streblomastix strix]
MSHNYKVNSATKPQPKPQEDKQFNITIVNLIGTKTKLKVKGSDTILDVKENFNNYTGSPINQQKLEFKGQTLLNKMTLNDYKIKDKDLLKVILVIFNEEIPENEQEGAEKSPLFTNMHIYIKTSTGKQLPLAVNNADTVKDIKEYIKVYFEAPIEKQTLEYKGQVLDDDKQLFDYGMEEGANIFAKINLFIVKVDRILTAYVQSRLPAFVDKSVYYQLFGDFDAFVYPDPGSLCTTVGVFKLLSLSFPSSIAHK